jgi:hypothetical protein
MSGSKIGSVVHYIRNQHKQHHKMSLMSFDDEFIVLLKKHGVRFRPNYVFGWGFSGVADRALCSLPPLALEAIRKTNISAALIPALRGMTKG